MSDDFRLPSVPSDLSVVEFDDLVNELYNRGENVVVILNKPDEDGRKDSRITHYRHNGNVYAVQGLLGQYLDDLRHLNRLEREE